MSGAVNVGRALQKPKRYGENNSSWADLLHTMVLADCCAHRQGHMKARKYIWRLEVRKKLCCSSCPLAEIMMSQSASRQGPLQWLITIT